MSSFTLPSHLLNFSAVVPVHH